MKKIVICFLCLALITACTKKQRVILVQNTVFDELVFPTTVIYSNGNSRIVVSPIREQSKLYQDFIDQGVEPFRHAISISAKDLPENTVTVYPVINGISIYQDVMVQNGTINVLLDEKELEFIGISELQKLDVTYFLQGTYSFTNHTVNLVTRDIKNEDTINEGITLFDQDGITISAFSIGETKIGLLVKNETDETYMINPRDYRINGEGDFETLEVDDQIKYVAAHSTVFRTIDYKDYATAIKILEFNLFFSSYDHYAHRKVTDYYTIKF